MYNWTRILTKLFDMVKVLEKKAIFGKSWRYLVGIYGWGR